VCFERLAANVVTISVGGVAGVLAFTADARTVADSEDGNPATATLTPTGNYVTLTCNDGDGCTITMGEAGIQAGHRVTIQGVSGTSTISDSSGVSELAGGAAAALAALDVLELIYTGSTWAEVSRSDN